MVKVEQFRYLVSDTCETMPFRDSIAVYKENMSDDMRKSVMEFTRCRQYMDTHDVISISVNHYTISEGKQSNDFNKVMEVVTVMTND